MQKNQQVGFCGNCSLKPLPVFFVSFWHYHLCLSIKLQIILHTWVEVK